MKHRLESDHDVLRENMREFAVLLSPQEPVELPGIIRRRMAFSNLFRSHLAVEEQEVQALRHGGVNCPKYRVQREYGIRLQSLFLDYSAHVNKWLSSTIMKNWSGYRASVLSLQRNYLEFMDWEERNLHPLLDDDFPWTGAVPEGANPHAIPGSRSQSGRVSKAY